METVQVVYKTNLISQTNIKSSSHKKFQSTGDGLLSNKSIVADF